MSSSIKRLSPPPPPSFQAKGSARGPALWPDDVVLNILQQAELPPDRLMQLRRTSKQFKRLCEGNALWRPWWSCGPRSPESGAGPRAHFDDLLGLPPKAREDLAKLWHLRAKQRTGRQNAQVTEIAQRHLDHPQIFLRAVELNPTVLKLAPPAWLEDHAAMARAIAANRFALGYVPQRFRENRTLVAQALRAPTQGVDDEDPWVTDDQQLLLQAIEDVGPEVLAHASHELRCDTNFMAEAVAIHSLCVNHAPQLVICALNLPLPAWREDSRAMIRAIEQNGDMLAFAPEPIRQDRAVLVAALRSSWKAIRYAPAWAKADAELILQVLRPDNISLLDEVARSLRGDRSFMDRALDVHGKCLSFALKPLWDDRALVLKSMRQDYLFILNVASARLQDDRSLMLEAVQMNGFALEHASPRLRADKEVVLCAVKKHGDALGYAARQLWADREVVLVALRQQAAFQDRQGAWSTEERQDFRRACCAPQYRADILAAFQEDAEVVLAYHAVFAHAPIRVVQEVFLAKNLAGDQKLIAELLSLDVLLPLWGLSKAVRGHRALALQAIEADAANLPYVSVALRNSPAFVLEAFALNPYCLPYAPRWLRNHKPFMLQACQVHELALKWASTRLHKDQQLVSRAVQYHGGAIQYAAWDLYEAFARAHPAAAMPAHVGVEQGRATSDTWSDWHEQRPTWPKLRAMGRGIANSPFALKALLKRSHGSAW